MIKPDDSSILLMLRDNQTRDQAVKLLFEQYWSTIRLLACKLLGDYHMAADISQDVFHEFWRSKRFMEEDITSFSAYLMGICRNKCADYISKQSLKASRQKEIQHSQPAQEQQTPGTTGDLSRYMAILPEQRWKDVILLVIVNDLTYADAARQLNLSTKSVEGLLYRAKKYLATKLLGDK